MVSPAALAVARLHYLAAQVRIRERVCLIICCKEVQQLQARFLFLSEVPSAEVTYPVLNCGWYFPNTFKQCLLSKGQRDVLKGNNTLLA